MNNILQTLVKGVHRTLALSGLAIVVLSGMVFGPMAQSASAVTCRQQNMWTMPNNYFTHTFPGEGEKTYQWTTDFGSYGGGFEVVPGPTESGCNYINVRNITGGWGAGGICWSFRVHKWTAPDTWYAEGGYCAGPNNILGIAGPIADGSLYAVFVVPNDNLRFILRD